MNVIFGSGQIGSRIAKLLVDRGEKVRVVARHPHGPAGAESMAGDASDLAFAAAAAKGATTVFDTMNPPYHKWKDELLSLGRGSLHAAKENGAKLVALDCLYMYGAPEGPMTETTPNAPRSKKGELRVQLADLRLGSGVPLAIGRASDFFGPDLVASWWSPRAFGRMLAGKPMEHLGDEDLVHSYSYADDVARGLIELRAVDGIWHLPTLPAISTRALGEQIAAAMGTTAKFTRMSNLLLRAIGIFQPFMKELIEMSYQWEHPFVIDDRKFRAKFGIEPTPLAEQIATTVRWAKARQAA